MKHVVTPTAERGDLTDKRNSLVRTKNAFFCCLTSCFLMVESITRFNNNALQFPGIYRRLVINEQYSLDYTRISYAYNNKEDIHLQ